MSSIPPISTISPLETSLNLSTPFPLNSNDQKTIQIFNNKKSLKESSEELVIKNKEGYIRELKQNLTNAIFKNDLSSINLILEGQVHFLNKDDQKKLKQILKFLLKRAILQNQTEIIEKLSINDLIKNLNKALVYAIKVESLEGVKALLKSPQVNQINLDNYSETLNSLDIPEQIQIILGEYFKTTLFK